MNGTIKILLLLMLAPLTACAPVVYENVYHEHRAPDHRGRSRVMADYRPEPPHYFHFPIEVTLYADHTYVGLYFNPIHLVFHDGDYLEVPIRNKWGRYTRAFAHYHHGELHFDKDRNCNRLKGSTAFKYDKKWERGRKYKRIRAGSDHDLRGINVEIRKKVVKHKGHDVRVERQVNKSKVKKVVKERIVKDRNRQNRIVKRTIVKKDRHSEVPQVVKKKRVVHKKVKEVSDKQAITRAEKNDKHSAEVIRTNKKIRKDERPGKSREVKTRFVKEVASPSRDKKVVRAVKQQRNGNQVQRVKKKVVVKKEKKHEEDDSEYSGTEVTQNRRRAKK